MQVIWALGCCMIFIAGMCWFSRALILIVSLLIIFSHNLFDGITVTEPYTFFSFLWSCLHVQHHFHWAHYHLEVAYPIIPWIGLAGLGYCLGHWMLQPVPVRTKKFFLLGLSYLLLFTLLRATNLYGDSHLWELNPKGVIYTFMSFINTTKYPPSLLYLLLNVGIVTLLWPLWEIWEDSSSRIVITFGKVAMFFYIIHLFVIHFIADANSEIFLHAAPNWWWSDIHKVVYPDTYHFSLTRAYLLWIAVLILLYPLCRFYQRYKAGHSYFWLKYL